MAEHFHSNGTFRFNIVGESHYQDNIEWLAGGRTEESAYRVVTAEVECDNNNPYDNNAVVVKIGGYVVGYLDREDAPKYRTWLWNQGLKEESITCPAVIVGGWKRGRDVGHFGVKLDLPSLSPRRTARAQPEAPMRNEFDFYDESEDRRQRRRNRPSLRSRVVYIVLAFFFGTLGIHNFYAGRTGSAIVQLVLMLVGLATAVLLVGFAVIAFVLFWNLVEIFFVTRDGEGLRFH
jgi:TM2 domain-containing membrane protein YozV